eukprot:3142857-Amphidinium_carterae.2
MHPSADNSTTDQPARRINHGGVQRGAVCEQQLADSRPNGPSLPKIRLETDLRRVESIAQARGQRLQWEP